MRHLLLCTLLGFSTLAGADELDALFGEDQAVEAENEHKPSSQAPPPARVVLPEPARSVPAPQRPQIEEIVVTAQKRQQSLSDVPISVTAVSGEKLVDAGIENLTDMSEYTPNLKLVDSGLIPNIYMRGVGSGSNQGFEMSVGIFADGIHLGRPHQTRAAFLDLERAEVLRGPQSILFGKNAIAGALNLVSARPGDAFEAVLGATTALPLEAEEYNAMISGPVSDHFGARIALRHRSEDGYLYNAGLNRLEPGLSETAGRLTLDWEPVAAWEGSLKLESTRREQRGRTFQTIDPGAITRCTGENVSLDRTKVTDTAEVAVINSYSATLSVRGELGGGTLDAISGYSGFDSKDLFDADSSSVDTLALLGLEEYDQLSQELRFSLSAKNFDTIFGVFYQQGDLSFYEFGPTIARAGGLADSPVCAVNTQPLAEADLERDFLIDGDAWSVFGQFVWYADALTVTGGLRWVQEQKTGYREFSIFEPGTRDPANPVSLAALDRLLINPHQLDGRREVGILLPSLNLQYAVTDEGMAYVAYTRGAKSGSYDARNNNGDHDDQGGATRFEFDDEVADSYEIGSKLRLFGGQADLNSAVFWVDYRDMQVSIYDGAAGFTVTNAGSARVRGLEVDGRLLLTEGLLLSTSLAWLDFEWTDYKEGPCYAGAPNQDPDSETCDLTGRENLQTPRYTAVFSGQYQHPIGRRFHIKTGVDFSFRDAHYISGDLDPRGRQKAHWKINARVALASVDERWSVGLIGKNLSDEMVMAVGAPTSLDVGGYRVATELPRMIYLDARMHF